MNIFILNCRDSSNGKYEVLSDGHKFTHWKWKIEKNCKAVISKDLYLLTSSSEIKIMIEMNLGRFPFSFQGNSLFSLMKCISIDTCFGKKVSYNVGVLDSTSETQLLPTNKDIQMYDLVVAMELTEEDKAMIESQSCIVCNLASDLRKYS